MDRNATLPLGPPRWGFGVLSDVHPGLRLARSTRFVSTLGWHRAVPLARKSAPPRRCAHGNAVIIGASVPKGWTGLAQGCAFGTKERAPGVAPAEMRL